MWLLVGLGNPGREHEGNRHNIGFMVADAMASEYGFPAFKSKYDGEIAQGTIGGEKVLLLKPMTYMNESGVSVQKAAKFYKIDTNRIAVFYDELDLPPGKMRVKKGGGAGGHNGIRSLDTHLINKEYWRVRCGIGHPGHKDRVHGYVLNDFSKEEVPVADALVAEVTKQIPLLLKGRESDFMTRVAEALR